MEKYMKRICLIIILVIIILTITGMIIYRKYSGGKAAENIQIKYSEELYCKAVDQSLVKHIPGKSTEYIVDELIIDGGQDSGYEDVEELVHEYDAKIVGYIAVTNTYQVETKAGITFHELSKLKERLEKENLVKKVYLNKIYPVDNLSGYYPNDAEWKKEWSDTAGGKNWGLEFIEAPEAWRYLRDSKKRVSDVNVGVFEVNSIDYTHEDLKDSFIERPLGHRENTLSKKELKSNPEKDIRNHGTAVSGIIGAGFDNGIGLTGMGQNIKLRASSWEGVSDSLNSQVSAMVCRTALAYFITTDSNRQKTAIINVSMGFDKLEFAASRKNKEARQVLSEINGELAVFLQALLDNGYDFLICKGSGNGNAFFDKEKRYSYVKADEGDENAEYGYIRMVEENKERYETYDDYMKRIDFGDVDAQYDFFSGITQNDVKNRIIVVGSVGIGKGNHFYASEYSCVGSRVDILAPGENIYVLEPGNAYADKGGWGTSYSAPYVSGVAGLVLSVNPKLSGAELKKILISTATGAYIGNLGKKSFNYKALNAHAAVRSVDRKTHKKSYIWAVRPDIEADNIYYLNSVDAWGTPVNMMNKQMEKNYGYAVIKKGTSYGLIDMDGNFLDGMEFQKVDTHESRYHVTYREPHYDAMTGTETTEFSLTEDGLSYVFGHGDVSNLYGGLYFWDGSLKQYYLANGMPEPEIPISVCEIPEILNDGSLKFKEHIKESQLVECCRNIDRKYALYAKGSLVTDFIYDECGSYSEGLMAVCKDGKWGYVDNYGELIIPIEYDASWKEYVPYKNYGNGEPEDFCYAASGGYVVLCRDGKWELRDTKGQKVIQPEIFEKICPVYNGKCWVRKNGKWGVIQITRAAGNEPVNLINNAERADEEKESLLKEFFYTWLDQWKFENGQHIFINSWKNDTADFSDCLAYISPDSELYSSLKVDSSYPGGRLANAGALNIQNVGITCLEKNIYKVSADAYLTQNIVDSAMYDQIVQNGGQILQYKVVVDDDGLVSEISKI